MTLRRVERAFGDDIPLVAFSPEFLVAWADRNWERANHAYEQTTDTHQLAMLGGKKRVYSEVGEWARTWRPERQASRILAQCVRSDGSPKTVWMSEADAARSAEVLRVNHYCCEACGGWHVGGWTKGPWK